MVPQPNELPRLRSCSGPYDPELGRCLHPATLRAKLGEDIARNALHCTDLVEDGPLECNYFFQLIAGGTRTCQTAGPQADTLNSNSKNTDCTGASRDFCSNGPHKSSADFPLRIGQI